MSVTWKDRQGPGEALSLLEVVQIVDNDPNGGLEWRHIALIATMYAENNGFYPWARPIVWAPKKDHHLSVDRGICALNSYWWSRVPDRQAYDPERAIKMVLLWLVAEAEKGTMGSRQWDWRPLLNWQWHAYGTDTFKEYLGTAREGVNVERLIKGLKPV